MKVRISDKGNFAGALHGLIYKYSNTTITLAIASETRKFIKSLEKLEISEDLQSYEGLKTDQHPHMKSLEEILFEIEDYIGGNVEGIEDVDRMSLTSFLRNQLKDYAHYIVAQKMEDKSDAYRSDWQGVVNEIMQVRSQGYNACIKDSQAHYNNIIGI